MQRVQQQSDRKFHWGIKANYLFVQDVRGGGINSVSVTGNDRPEVPSIVFLSQVFICNLPATPSLVPLGGKSSRKGMCAVTGMENGNLENRAGTGSMYRYTEKMNNVRMKLYEFPENIRNFIIIIILLHHPVSSFLLKS